MSIQDIFASNMRKYRKAAHLSQEGLAEKSGLHRTYIGGIEQKRINVSMKNIEKIARALDIDPALLFLHYEQDVAAFSEKNKKSTAKKRPTEQRERAIDSEQNKYALCSLTDDGIVLYPLHVRSVDLTVQILCALITEGFQDKELAEEYHAVHDQVFNLFKESRHLS